MHGIRYFLPRCDLRVVVDPRCVGVSAGAGGDGRCFAYEEGAGDRGTLGVVFFHDGEGDVVIVGAETGHGCHGDAVGELDAADAKGGEEFGHFGLDLGLGRSDRCMIYLIYLIYIVNGRLFDWFLE